MSENKITDLPLVEKGNTETLPTEEKKVFSRRQALLGALFGAGAVLAQTAKAAEASCACLAPPDCDTICPNGGTPRGDGTQACDCNAAPVQTQAELENIVTAGTAGLSADVTMNRNITRTTVTYKCSSSYYYSGGDPCKKTPTSVGYSLAPLDEPTGSFKIPYFTVDSKGRITSYATRTVTIQNKFTDKTATQYYYNYSEYYDSNCTDSYD